MFLGLESPVLSSLLLTVQASLVCSSSVFFFFFHATLEIGDLDKLWHLWGLVVVVVCLSLVM